MSDNENARVEYRVKPVTRYIITRNYQDDNGSETTQRGEYDNPHIAWECAYGMCKIDHEHLGYPAEDERIQYPRLPETA